MGEDSRIAPDHRSDRRGRCDTSAPQARLSGCAAGSDRTCGGTESTELDISSLGKYPGFGGRRGGILPAELRILTEFSRSTVITAPLKRAVSPAVSGPAPIPSWFLPALAPLCSGAAAVVLVAFLRRSGNMPCGTKAIRRRPDAASAEATDEPTRPAAGIRARTG